jgi:1-acyl-sn-glycerol-3-phosphate acyltransferase
MSVGARAQIKFDVGFLAKKELFQWYSGWIFKALGGFPLDRGKAQNQVEAVANTFQKHERMHIAIAPEGTRSDVVKLKTGFYYIALKVNIPLILIGFDYPRKAFVINDPIYLTGNFQKDMKIIYDFYLTIEGPKKTWLKEYAKTGQIPLPAKN